MFFRLEIVRARFIGGFGRYFWLTRDELCLKHPFSPQEESDIIQHLSEAHKLHMTGIDSEGFDVLQKSKNEALPF